MPEYNPQIHEPVTVSLREIDFVQALTDINSPTFGNYYRSAIKAGYTHSYARIIRRYFPKERINHTQEKRKWPQFKFWEKTLREERKNEKKKQKFIEVTPSKKSIRQQQAQWKKQEKLVLREYEKIFGTRL